MSCPIKPDSPTEILIEHTEKGSVHWFDLEGNIDPKISSQKARPYIIIGRNNYNSGRVIISPLSGLEHYIDGRTNKMKYPYHAPLYKSEYNFLEKDSAVLSDQVYTISKDELCEEWYMGKIDNVYGIDLAIIYNYNLFNTTKELYTKLISRAESYYASDFTRK